VSDFFQQVGGYIGQLVRQTIAVAIKDLHIELRSPVRLIGVFFFALALLLMSAVSSGTSIVMSQIAGGTLWLGVLLTSTRSLDQSFAIEKDEDALEEMVLWPTEPAAIYYGKAVANTVVLLIVVTALTPLVIAIFDAPVRGDLLQFVLILALGCAALAAPGTLYAAIASHARGSSVLLPLLMFPLVIPALMAASIGTTAIMDGDPMNQASIWLRILIGFNVIHWLLSGVLFRFVVEEA
jgi:heme exporter protein B